MTRDEKLAVHLEYIIFEDLPEGLALTAAEVRVLGTAATNDQKRRAFQRALYHVPLLIQDERVQWLLVRHDGRGKSYLIRDQLDSKEARRLYEELTAAGHKLQYSIHDYLPQSYDNLLRDLRVVNR